MTIHSRINITDRALHPAPIAPRPANLNRPAITPEQIAEIGERMLTAISLRAIAREMDLDKQTVCSRAQPIIAAMRQAGTLGLCECGRERFHKRICTSKSPKIVRKWWGTEDYTQRRAAIVAAIVSGQTFRAIAQSFRFETTAAARAYLRYLTPEQQARRKATEGSRRRPLPTPTVVRPLRDRTYALIASAMPRGLSEASRDDAISDAYVAYLEGRFQIEDVAAEAKRFAWRTIAAFENKFGPRSLNEEIFETGDTTSFDRLECPAALAAFDEIRFASEDPSSP